MGSDLLRRKATHFVLWRPRPVGTAPALVIGEFQPGNPPSVVNQRRVVMTLAPGVTGLWQIAATDCGLRDGRTYHYWFEVDDTVPHRSPPGRILCTDPTAFAVDWRLLADRLPPPYEITGEFIAAKLIGRWKDGSSLTRYQYESRIEAARRGPVQVNDTVRARTTAQAAIEAPVRAAPTRTADGVTAEPSRKTSDNDFLFGTEDPEALRCPFGAHIRRANPRDSFDPGSNDQIAITNRHRIIRVGRIYQEKAGENPGLLFMCLNGDIERQFEFVQQTWLMSPSFHGLSCEKDPVLGDGEAGACGFTIPSRDGPIALSPMPAFITTKGGGYFFLPGKRLIEYLSSP